MLGVIGSGFGRTGTTSRKAALEQLGFGRCYHMQEVLQRPSHMRAWGVLAARGDTDPIELFDRFGATADFPACLLDVPLPDRSFPRVNDKVVFRRRLEAIRAAGWALPAVTAGGLALLTRRRIRGRAGR